MGPILEKAVAAGSIDALFPMLADWSDDDLNRLVYEADVFCEKSQELIEWAWKDLAILPQNFMNKKAAKALDDERKRAEMDVVAMCAEVSSVALYFLKFK